MLFLDKKISEVTKFDQELRLYTKYVNQFNSGFASKFD